MNSRKLYLLVFLVFFVCPATCLPQQPQPPKVVVIPREDDDLSPRERRLREAVKKYDEAIRLNPKNNFALYLRGNAKLFFMRDFEGALADYNKAIEIAPDARGVEQIYNNRGISFHLLGEKDRALADFEKAILINPEYSAAYNGRGNILAARGELEKAFLDYDRAIELNPKSVPAYLGRADVYFKKGDLDKSLADWEKGLELDPDNAAAYLNKGMILGLKGFWYAAEKYLKKAVGINLNSSSFYSGGIAISLLDFDKYIAENPENAKAYAIRGLIKLFQERKDEAATDFKKAFALDSDLKKELKDLLPAVK